MKVRFILASLLALAILLPAKADYFTPIQFKRGQFSTVIHHTLPADQEKAYTFRARAGQNAVIALASDHDNALFRLYYATSTEAWEYVPGFSHLQGRRVWYGSLPRSVTGEYLLVVESPIFWNRYALFLGLPPSRR